MVKKVYMQVTHDKYELPTAIADSVPELAEALNTSVGSIYSALSHYKHQGKYTTYREVEIEEEADGQQDIKDIKRAKQDK